MSLWNSLWMALGLALACEGLLPLVAPARWKAVFARMLAFSDGQIRFFGLVSLLAGASALLVGWLI